jgi:sigma-B regulation protein RsbU (phosphoserine phosphatase)
MKANPATPTGWQERLAAIVETMREMSCQTDPQEMVRAYAARVRELVPADGRMGLSRRDLTAPQYRITRSSTWGESINPWKDRDRLPLLQGGLLAELLYANEPRIIDDLRLADDEPAREYLAGQRSLAAIPLYDRGVALNMVVLLRREPAAFSREQFPDLLWVSNLFGRATSNLVLSEELQTAYRALDREMKVVADIQRSLLPAPLPAVPGLELAASYQTAERAGGDYYDLFPLQEGKWGLLIADVSGHGTPAAVLMAVTHAIAHTCPGPCITPSQMLRYVNTHLCRRYTSGSASFVTAFYGVYDPATRELAYACAGHNPPRLRRGPGEVPIPLDGAAGLPLGVWEEETYAETSRRLRPGDQVVFYTDGLTEAHGADGTLFGLARLDAALAAGPHTAAGLLEAVLRTVEAFTAGAAPDDDRTLLIAQVL